MNDIMDKSTFINDQREMVLRAIKRKDSTFEPAYTPPDLNYSNKLLDSLNENLHSIDVGPEEFVSVSHFLIVCSLS